MSLTKKNIVANMFGGTWQALMGIIFVPFYIRFIGIESWGLIGFYTTLLMVFGFLDAGISGTLNREIARLSALPDKQQEMHDLLRTLEMIYWCVAVLGGVLIMVLSGFLSHHWIRSAELSPSTVEQAILIMGGVIALQMPLGFYTGGLIGLQKQVLLNIVTACSATFRGFGAVLILWLFSPTIQAYFLWQVVVSALTVFILRASLKRKMPAGVGKGFFRGHLLAGIWKFAAGVSGISILAVLLIQADKILLSKLLPLEMFGYYALASMMAISLLRIIVIPVYNSIYPKLTQLVSIGDEKRVSNFYHESCQFMSALLLPVASTVVFFSYEILLLWTQSIDVAEKTHILVRILICGSAINGVMYCPVALQMAYGWTKLSFCKNLIALFLLVPMLIFLTRYYGAAGGASVWLILNIGYILLEIPVLHHRLLKNEKWPWYLKDICCPLLAAMMTAAICRKLMVGGMPTVMNVFYMVGSLIVTFGVTAMVTPVSRRWLIGLAVRIRSSVFA